MIGIDTRSSKGGDYAGEGCLVEELSHSDRFRRGYGVCGGTWRYFMVL